MPHRSTGASWATLRDGSPIVIRPIAAGDRAALRAAFDLLGEQSRYERFLSPMRTLTGAQLNYLTHVDHRDHEALIAIDATSGAIVGSARFVRLQGPEAEPAIAIADAWQGRGLGTVLMAALGERARSEGITRYRATVLAQNEPILRLLASLGEMRYSQTGPHLEVDVVLDGPRSAPDVERSAA